MNPDASPARWRSALARATEELFAAREPAGHWSGELSSSALSTATAVTALAVVQRAAPSSSPERGCVVLDQPQQATAPSDRKNIPTLTRGETAAADPALRGTQPRSGSRSDAPSLPSPIASGLGWLAQNQNRDGGWGDTLRSHSNLSTTVLVWAAFGAVPGAEEKNSETVRRACVWIAERIGVAPDSLAQQTDTLARAVIARYGKDRTFSVPILTMCALAGRLGEGRDAWRHVIPLPFELAAAPHQLFAALRLPVVSYALPALIAIGQARHVHAPSRNPFARLLRNLARARTLRILGTLQPINGGFLEATPLTSFVTMSLAGSGQENHPVTQRGVKFLLASQRADGSWPIDTNLATWLTTLTVNAGPKNEEPERGHPGRLAGETPALRWNGTNLLNWLLAQQYRVEHPYTHAAPGGWAWTNLPGGVPDADDTAGALLALARLGKLESGSREKEIREAANAGVNWLLDLQNRDGGIPTFCRGWGALPFDRSSADITAHALRAWSAWAGALPQDLQSRVARATTRALQFLCRTQRGDGSWTPLWFGNQFEPNEENPTYGTARVLHALVEIRAGERGAAESAAMASAARWLLAAQNETGGWGGFPNSPVSVEETALAVEALACLLASGSQTSREEIRAAVTRGADWLAQRVESGAWREPAPIGFYFAKLWYYERLYPLIFTVGALRAAARALQKTDG